MLQFEELKQALREKEPELRELSDDLGLEQTRDRKAGAAGGRTRILGCAGKYPESAAKNRGPEGKGGKIRKAGGAV